MFSCLILPCADFHDHWSKEWTFTYLCLQWIYLLVQRFVLITEIHKHFNDFSNLVRYICVCVNKHGTKITAANNSQCSPYSIPGPVFIWLMCVSFSNPMLFTADCTEDFCPLSPHACSGSEQSDCCKVNSTTVLQLSNNWADFRL